MPAKFKKAAITNRPAVSAFFGLEIDGVNEASFSKATGVSAEVETFAYQEGGVNHFEHKLPTRTKFSNITLERGTTTSKDLLTWFAQIKEGVVARKDFTIILWNSAGEVLRRWNFKNGYPVKWSVGDLDAQGSQVLLETLELAHEGFTEG